ncbi:MAG: 50S ribosomal protein L35 [Acidimicrobiales bacterium]|jgi:large subunit ribosomal protein L35
MPKMKTDKGAAARFKVTGSGRIVRRKRNRKHLMEKKSSTRARRLGRMSEVAPSDTRAVKRLLGM